MSDLLLGVEATSSSRAVTVELARILEQWQGPGLVVVCGNLFEDDDEESARRAFAAHPELSAAVRAFAGEPDRRVIVLPGWRDPTSVAAVTELGAEVQPAVDLRLMTAAGPRRVLVRAGVPLRWPCRSEDLTTGRPWLTGADRLEDPATTSRFVTSRTMYRRLARYSWTLLVPALAALCLRTRVVFDALGRVVDTAPGPRQALAHAYGASWPDRVQAAVVATVLVIAVFVAAQLLLSRPVWRALGGGALGRAPRPGRSRRAAVGEAMAPSALQLDGEDALDRAREWLHRPTEQGRPAREGDVHGVVVGGSLLAELVHLDPGFYACPGGTTELVREHPGRLGLPPVFVPHCQASWLEIETGAGLHARLLLADVTLPTSTPYERLCAADRVMKGRKPAADLRPALVASWPHGDAWPKTFDVPDDRVAARRVRRIAAAAIFTAGVVDLLEAVHPPGHGHLRVVEQVLSLGDVETARALMGFAAVALVMLSRGLLRGQRRSWVVAVALLAATVVLRLLGGALVAGLALNAGVLVLLLVERRRFCAAIDHRSWRSAASTLVVGCGLAVGGAVAAVELTRHHRPLPGWPAVLGAVLERLVGVRTIELPPEVDRWISPSLFAVGCALLLVVAFLATRPVVDRRLSSGAGSARRVAELRARDIVRRHGSGSLDYFALRDDKQWFFHRDSLVAYAVYGGVCLVSPDPIGPDSERVQAWSAFRRFADTHGWAVAIVGASEEWLPVFRSSGMRHAYIGDEAVVAVQSFSLAGGHMKGLRQACTRAARNGYRVAFLDPTHLAPDVVEPVLELIGRNRRGGRERGFSMTLSRVFDPRDTDLLLTVVYGPDGDPAAVCQFVPSRAIGGYSLDVMRRDPGEHPNGILDFALCATIEHLQQQGCQGLSLNFAALRATLDGETGSGWAQRVERWALRRMSGVLQIESLWRFNAKYHPTWLPRYVVFDCAEQFVPTVVNILRAESLNEVPVIGRLLSIGSPADRREQIGA